MEDLNYTIIAKASLSGEIIQTVKAKQGDCKSRYVKTSILKNGQEPYIIPDGIRATVAMKKPDGTQAVNNAAVTGASEVTFELTDQMLAAPGKAMVEIILSNSSSILSTALLKVIIIDQVRDNNKMESTDEYKMLTDTITIVNDTIDKINEAMDNVKDGTTYVPSVSDDGIISWTNGQGMDNPDPVNIKGPQGEPGTPGEPGAPGEPGQPGADGQAATIQVGEITTLEPGQPATVTNTGTSTDAILNFGIPRGDGGNTYTPGAGITITDDTISVDTADTVAIGDMRPVTSNAVDTAISGTIRDYLGLPGDGRLGLQVDYQNKALTRLADAQGLSSGADFDQYIMYGGRRKCIVADDGSIVAWYGDSNYTEDGSIGQVMVYQPKFYYRVVPLKYDPIDTGIGYNLRKVNYYVSSQPLPGYHLHPAFYDADGTEIDYYLTSAYEGSIWDASAGAYLLDDEQVMDVSTDKLCSIAGVKPASGITQLLTRANVEKLANNRGEGWHSDSIKQVSAEQLLMAIEMGTLDMQTAIANGVVNTTDISSHNCSAITGSTSPLGNGTGQASETTYKIGGETSTETENGKTSVCWRGKENIWGNIWTWVDGINVWGNGAMGGGQPYICTNLDFADGKNNDNYQAAGFTLSNTSGYISAMAYSSEYDWLFVASECTGNSSLPVGDYDYIAAPNLNNYGTAKLGNRWDGNTFAGLFCWNLGSGVNYRDRNSGGRLVYIPTKNSPAYHANIASWQNHVGGNTR